MQDISQKFFKNYIELDTSLDSGENYPIAINLLVKFLKPLGFSTKQVRIPADIAGPNRVNLIATKIIDKQLPTLLLYNHIDVVKADYKAAFKFEIRQGRAYGRGTADHKGGTVALLDSLTQIKDQELKFNLIFLATTDEETDQIDQLRYIQKFLVLPKDTVMYDTDTFAGGVTIAHLGHIQLTLIVKGKAVHSAMSNLGENAVFKSIKYLKLINELNQEAQQEQSGYKAFPSSGLEQVRSSINPTIITAGTSQNTIPGSITIKLDARYIPEANVQSKQDLLIREIKALAQKNNDDIEVNEISVTQGLGTDHKLADKLSSVYESITGEGGKYCILGSAPFSQWASELGIANIGLGVARGDSNVHGVNEAVSLEDIENLSLTLQKFLTS